MRPVGIALPYLFLSSTFLFQADLKAPLCQWPARQCLTRHSSAPYSHPLSNGDYWYFSPSALSSLSVPGSLIYSFACPKWNKLCQSYWAGCYSVTVLYGASLPKKWRRPKILGVWGLVRCLEETKSVICCLISSSDVFCACFSYTVLPFRYSN